MKIKLQIKELKLYIDRLEPLQKSMLLAMAILLKLQMLKDIEDIEMIIAMPTLSSRDQLLKIYNALGILINNANNKMRSMQIPEYAKAHFTLTNNALLVWMATISIGIIPSSTSLVLGIQNDLLKVKFKASEAIKQLREIEKQTIIDCEHNEILFDIADNEWCIACMMYEPTKIRW